MFVGLQLLDVAAHARRFQLEHAEGLALAEHLHRLRVAVGDVDEVDLVAGGVADEVDGALPRMVRLERPRKSILSRPILATWSIANCVVGMLVFVAAARALERHVLDERVARDDDAGGVGARVARDAFELLRGLDAGGGPSGPLRTRSFSSGDLLERVVEGDVEGVRDEPGDAVGLGVGDAERAADIADRGLRAERPEGDDLGDAVRAVAVVGEADHLVAAVVGEVEVDVGHLAAFEVEEALEDEAVGDRVDVGDVERRRGRARPRPSRARPCGCPALRAKSRDLLDHVNVVREAGLA